MGDNKECNKKPPSSDDMEDDSGLELSLGLSCGGFVSKTKGKDCSKEFNVEQGGNDKMKNGKVNAGDASMKHFLQGSIGEQDTEVKQLNESTFQPQQNFWMSLGKSPAKEPENSMEMPTNQVQFSGFREPWFSGEKSVKVLDRSISMEKAKGDQQQTQSMLNQQHEALEQQNVREMSDQKWQEVRKKRKMVEDQKQHKKGEKEDERPNTHGKTSSGIPSLLKSSISATTQDVFSPDNEDTADSGTEASSSRIVSTMGNDSVKQCMATGTDVLEKKESQSPVTRTTTAGNESNSELSSSPCVTPVAVTSTTLPYSLQPFPVVPVPYSHPIPVPNNPGVSFPSGFSLPYLMQFMSSTVNGADRITARPMNSSGFQLPPGYAPFQLPTLETTPSWMSFSHSQQSSVWARNMGGARASSEHGDDESKISQAAIQVCQGALGGLRPGSSETASQECQKSESTKLLMKDERQQDRTGDLSNSDVGGTCLSSQAVDNDAKGHGVAWPRENMDNLSMTDGLSQEVLNLRPGIAAGMKFGGTGNSPDLPWVSTTGPGPNGRTISGVMYRYGRNQVRIVCACHGRHMSPSEFVQHAGSADVSNLENDVVANSFPNGSQATSAQG